MVKAIKYRWRYRKIQQAIKNGEPLKIIVGAAETYQDGWYSTNEQWLDISREDHWNRLFKNQALISHVVAEHVFEHLTREEAVAALRNIRRHLKADGRVRIAVPDGYHPDPDYIRNVGINGIGDDAADHKQLLNLDSLSEIFKDAGFQPEPLEGYQQDGSLLQKQWNPTEGYIHRSRQNETTGVYDFVDAETSLIIDCIPR